MSLVLSLFPGIGLLDMAFEQEGFCVVRGPDLLWGGDVRKFHPPIGRFDGVIGGPPCQTFSRLRHLVEHNGFKVAENLIPEYERAVREAAPRWFLMENVPAAPAPVVEGFEVHTQMLNNRWCGGEQNRARAISFGTRSGSRLHIATETFEPAGYTPCVTAQGTRWVPIKVGGSGKTKRTHRPAANRTTKFLREAVVAQGLPEDFDLPPFTVAAKVRAVGNGVPLFMGRAIARAVREALRGKEAA